MGRCFLCTVLCQMLVGAVAKPRSTALVEARTCIVKGGRLNLFRPRHASRHFPRCVHHDGCPSGSTEVHDTCVAPVILQEEREIMLTLHAPCSSCQADNGLELSSKLWLAVAAALQVPLQETVASALLVREEQWQHNPVQHFTILKADDPPWLPNPGRLVLSAADVGMAWDLFVAIRIHTSRIDSGDSVLAQLSVGHAGPILEVLGQNAGVQVFEVSSRKTSQVRNLNDLEATFKFGDLPWGQKPPPVSSLPRYDYKSYGNHAPPGPWSRSPAPPPSMPLTSPTSAKVPLPTTTGLFPSTSYPKVFLATTSACQCPMTWLGDGVCDLICDLAACQWDAGDCESPASAPREEIEARGDAVTTSIAWPNGLYRPSTSALPLPRYMRDFRMRQSSVVSLQAKTDSLGRLNVVASDASYSWNADGFDEEEYDEGFDPSPILLACFVFGVCCILPVICFLARCRRRDHLSEGNELGPNLQRDGYDDGKKAKRSGDGASIYSTSTTDSGRAFTNSWSFSDSPTSKETKVHPEPDLENPPQEGCHKSFSDWRLPKMKPSPGNSSSAKQKGFRPEQHDWQKPVRPQPFNCWSDGLEEERCQQQGKADRLREEEMWCHKKRQEFDSRDKFKRCASEPPRSSTQWFGYQEFSAPQSRSDRQACDNPCTNQRAGDLSSAASVPQNCSAKVRADSIVDNVQRQLDSTRKKSLEERRKLFRDLQRQFHPDKQLEDQEAAKLVFQTLMEMRDAYLS